MPNFNVRVVTHCQFSNRENFSSGVNNVVNDFLSNSLQMQEKQVTESELEFDRTETLQ